MLIKQLSLFIENRPGSLSAVCNVLKEHNLSITTLSLADTKQFGVLRLLLKDHDYAKKIMEEAGFVVKTTEVLAISVEDRAGGLADILKIVDKHNLSIEYMYAFVGSHNKKAIMTFRFSDPQLAVEKLKDEPLEILSNEDIFA